ncbi:hypothetical protein H0H87_009286 [Tephrocybe sp. NHM501043]|nr:hypothetical protein H0H87_009286 [Tephrocybe sp. NHM501043]
MAAAKDTSYGNPPFLQKLGAIATLVLELPVSIGWTLLTSPFHRTNKHKTLIRIAGVKLFRVLTGRLNAKQLQWGMGDTLDVYKAHMKSQKLPLVVDELGENSRLLWFGERRTDRVILYFHGGAYIIPPAICVPPFWTFALGELKSRGKETGFAMLQYSLHPTATFPTQLKQAVLAVQHLLDSGVAPQNIQLTGDSAGGNMIFKLISHILHPVPSVPRLTLSSPFSGAYAMSPWVNLTSDTGSMITNGDSDVIGREALIYWGNIVLNGVLEEYRPYLEPYYAPEDWFANMSSVVKRVFITAGDAECLRDSIVVFADRVAKQHPAVQFLLQKHGVHNDPFFDFMGSGQVRGELTPPILDFFASD